MWWRKKMTNMRYDRGKKSEVPAEIWQSQKVREYLLALRLMAPSVRPPLACVLLSFFFTPSVFSAMCYFLEYGMEFVGFLELFFALSLNPLDLLSVWSSECRLAVARLAQDTTARGCPSHPPLPAHSCNSYREIRIAESEKYKSLNQRNTCYREIQ